jgi:hypothetical protein
VHSLTLVEVGMGYWWLAAKTYLRDRPLPEWVNKGQCILPNAGARYEDKYSGVDRSLSGLATRPVFTLDHRERRPLAIRSLSHTYSEQLGSYFLLSRDFAALISDIDPGALVSTDCDVRCHGRKG